MIDEIQLREIAVHEGMPVGTIEKELALACVLYIISYDKLQEHLIFKGGTAIKMIYYPTSRFSEDLDFTVIEMGEDELIPHLHEVINEKKVGSITFQKASEERFSQEGKRLRLPFIGPLNFRNSIKIDLSFRNDILLRANPRHVKHFYGEDLVTMVKTLEFVELLAEKLRALMSRGYARDYYDVWSHIDKVNDKIHLKELTEDKCAIIDYPFSPTKIFDKNSLDQARAEWRNQLGHLIRDYVDFEEVIPKLQRQLAFLINST